MSGHGIKGGARLALSELGAPASEPRAWWHPGGRGYRYVSRSVIWSGETVGSRCPEENQARCQQDRLTSHTAPMPVI